MNIELKFRAYDQFNDCFYFSDKVGLGKFFIMVLQLNLAKNNISVMRFTGLKDKNGKEIYEGDILKELLTYKPVHFSEVKLGTDDWGVDYNALCWNVEHLDGSGNQALVESQGYGVKVNQCEVIGNIYEHPESIQSK